MRDISLDTITNRGETYKGSLFAYGFAVLIASLFSYFVYTKDFISGNSKLFEEGDFSQHLAGWQFYRDDDWRFPLLHTERLNAPEGVSIAYTDSIPLLAILFKIFSPLLPQDFQYFGVWHIFVIIFQAVGGVFLIRSFRCYQWYAPLFAALFALCLPVLPWRLGHSSLMAHGLMLFALGFYYRGISGIWSRDGAAYSLILTALIGLLIHPYWLAICSGVFFAFLLDDLRTGGSFRRMIHRLAIFFAGLLFIVFAFGYTGSGFRAEGFGLYSMNLTSPFCGGRLTPCYVDATKGQYEGFNYLGAGVWMVILIGVGLLIWHRRLNVFVFYKRHLGIALCLFGYAIYSLSNKIYLGNILIYEFPIPDFLTTLTGIFRASGRFFWLVGYFLTFSFLALVLRSFRQNQASVILAFALSLQWFDVQPHWQRFIDRVRQKGENDLVKWEKVISNVEQINLHPAFGCKEGEIGQYFFFQRLAAHFHLKLDTGYIARPNINCQAKAAKFWQTFEKNQLYILAAPFFNRAPTQIPYGFKIALERDECFQWRYALICKPGAKSEDWQTVPLVLQNTERYIADRLQWRPDNLYTNIGIIIDGELRPANPKAHDFLSFGPYVSLPPGAYRAFLEYRSNLPPDQPAGVWDAVAAPLDGGHRRIYAEGNLMGTDGNLQAIKIEFDVADHDGPLEIRTVYPGYGDLRIVRLVIEPR